MTHAIHGSRIDIGIITIRRDEYEEVLQRIPASVVRDGRGDRRYRISELKCSDNSIITVAVTRCLEQGTVEAQKATSDLIEDLRPQWILVVGIAGGVPNSDFSLGDVVVASRIYDLTLEASKQGGKREYSVKGEGLHEISKRVVQDLPAPEQKNWHLLVGTARPSLDVSSIDDKVYGDEDWKKEVITSLRKHFSSPRNPIVVVCPIASSDRLVKDSEIPSAWLSVARHICAFEMELAGVAKAAGKTPVLAVKGISDIVGLKRDEIWTSYAAKTAAAFAVSTLVTGQLPLVPKLTPLPRDRVQIFLSYHPTDREFAVKLALELRKRSISVWADFLNNVTPSTFWVDTLENAIEAGDGTIAVISDNYLRSRYCQTEFKRAAQLSRPILAALLSEETKDAPQLQGETVEPLSFADWQRDAEFQVALSNLINYLTAKLGVAVDLANSDSVENQQFVQPLEGRDLDNQVSSSILSNSNLKSDSKLTTIQNEFWAKMLKQKLESWALVTEQRLATLDRSDYPVLDAKIGLLEREIRELLDKLSGNDVG